MHCQVIMAPSQSARRRECYCGMNLAKKTASFEQLADRTLFRGSQAQSTAEWPRKSAWDLWTLLHFGNPGTVAFDPHSRPVGSLRLLKAASQSSTMSIPLIRKGKLRVIKSARANSALFLPHASSFMANTRRLLQASCGSPGRRLSSERPQRPASYKTVHVRSLTIHSLSGNASTPKLSNTKTGIAAVRVEPRSFESTALHKFIPLVSDLNARSGPSGFSLLKGSFMDDA